MLKSGRLAAMVNAADLHSSLPWQLDVMVCFDCAGYLCHEWVSKILTVWIVAFIACVCKAMHSK